MRCYSMDRSNNLNKEIMLEESVASHKQVFLCYCHEDLRYARRLLVHLASCRQTYGLTVWDDSQLQSGSLWKIEVTSALANAHFAVLLISADFLASPFIMTFELPRLLKAAQSDGTQIISVILHPCLFEESPLAAFQATNDPARPLSLLTRSSREQIWVSVARRLIYASNTPIDSY